MSAPGAFATNAGDPASPEIRTLETSEQAGLRTSVSGAFATSSANPCEREGAQEEPNEGRRWEWRRAQRPALEQLVELSSDRLKTVEHDGQA